MLTMVTIFVNMLTFGYLNKPEILAEADGNANCLGNKTQQLTNPHFHLLIVQEKKSVDFILWGA